jgi:hypothetical protein
LLNVRTPYNKLKFEEENWKTENRRAGEVFEISLNVIYKHKKITGKMD